MEAINWFIDFVLQALHRLFSFMPPLAGLTFLAALTGVAMLWVFGKTSNQARMKQVKRRIQAGLLELRLFVNEPAISLRAQKGLMAANMRYLGLALRPALWLAVPIGLLLIHLEAFYERAPLPLAAPALVTMKMKSDWNPSTPAPQLIAPPGVRVLGPPVRVAATREVSWRIEPDSAGSRTLEFRYNGEEASKSLEAGGPQRYTPGKIVRSGWRTLFTPGEGGIHADFAESIEIGYGDADLRMFGIRVNWLVWFLVVSMAAGLLLKKRFGVVI